MRNKELDIMNKILEEKCNAYEAKGILGYTRGKAAKENMREEATKGPKESENTNRREIGHAWRQNQIRPQQKNAPEFFPQVQKRRKFLKLWNQPQKEEELHELIRKKGCRQQTRNEHSRPKKEHQTRESKPITFERAGCSKDKYMQYTQNT